MRGEIVLSPLIAGSGEGGLMSRKCRRNSDSDRGDLICAYSTQYGLTPAARAPRREPRRSGLTAAGAERLA